MRPRQNGRQFPDDILKWIFFNENVWISIEISLKFVPKGQINNIPALVQKMAWRRPGDKPFYEPMIVSLLAHICVTRPQWVNHQEFGYITHCVIYRAIIKIDIWFLCPKVHSLYMYVYVKMLWLQYNYEVWNFQRYIFQPNGMQSKKPARRTTILSLSPSIAVYCDISRDVSCWAESNDHLNTRNLEVNCYLNTDTSIDS